MKHSNSCDLPCESADRTPRRFRMLLLFFLALAAVLSSRSAIRLNSVLNFPTYHVQTHPLLYPAPPMPNATLLRLASTESADPYGLAEVDYFLRHIFNEDPSPPGPQPSFPRLATREAANHLLTIYRRTTRSISALPAFRRAFLSWSGRRRPEPGPVMFDISSLFPRHRRCAVVGNSGILLHGSHGPHIDAHDLVIRLNNARVSGFEPHVGSKTNLSFVNSNILHLCGLRPGCPCHRYGLDVPLVMYICQAQHFLDYIVCGGASVGRQRLLLTDPRLDLLCARIVKYYSLKRFVESTGRPPEEWKNAHDPATFHYSSGMEAVVMALGICQEVNLFGFGKDAAAKHHYHTNQARELPLHDYGAEYEFYDNLARSHESIPFLGDSGFKIPSVSIHT